MLLISLLELLDDPLICVCDANEVVGLLAGLTPVPYGTLDVVLPEPTEALDAGDVDDLLSEKLVLLISLPELLDDPLVCVCDASEVVGLLAGLTPVPYGTLDVVLPEPTGALDAVLTAPVRFDEVADADGTELLVKL